MRQIMETFPNKYDIGKFKYLYTVYYIKKLLKMWLTKRSVAYKAPTNIKLQLYNTVGRCNLEYASQEWSPRNNKDIEVIETVQSCISRYILGPGELSYPERFMKLDLLPLSFRREIMDLMFFS